MVFDKTGEDERRKIMFKDLEKKFRTLMALSLPLEERQEAADYIVELAYWGLFGKSFENAACKRLDKRERRMFAMNIYASLTTAYEKGRHEILKQNRR